MKLSRKISLSIALVVVIVQLVIMYGIYNNSMTNIKEDEDRYIQSIQTRIMDRIDEDIKLTTVSVAAIANNPDIAKMFAERDREGLTNALLPVFDSIKSTVSQFQFHLPDSTSFLRLHNPEKYGDSLKDFRFTVNEANASKTTVAGIEEGKAGYGLRVVMPVSYEGEHIGTVEFGSSFGSAFLEKIKSEINNEVFLYTINANSVAWEDNNGLIAGTIEEDLYPASAEQIAQVKAGNLVTYDAGKDNKACLIPFTDYKGDIAGYIKFFTSTQTYRKATSDTLLIFGLSLVFFLFIIILTVTLITKKVLQPLNDAGQSLDKIADGDFTTSIQTKSKDEIGVMVKNINRMVTSLKGLMLNVNDVTAKIDDSYGEITLGIEGVETNSRDISEAIDEIAKGATEQANNVGHSLDKANELADKIANIAGELDKTSSQVSVMKEASASGMVVLQNLKESFGHNESTTNKVVGQIDELSAKSNAIGDIVILIQNITDEINLLALNASIEAARAGEQGRGFAVVASEVGKLADQSAKATSSIQSLIDEIAALIRQADIGMHETKESFAKAGESIVESEDAFTSIDKKVSELVTSNDQLSNLAVEVTSDKNLVVSDISHILEVSENTAAATEEIGATTQEQGHLLSELLSQVLAMQSELDSLREGVGQFRL